MSELEMTIEALKLCIHPDVFAKAMEQVSVSDPVQIVHSGSDEDSARKVIEQLLLNAGMPTHIRGYRYASTGIRLLLEEPELADAITKQLYPRIAKLHDSTPSRVERGIRHGIEVAWSRGDLAVLYDYFRNTVSGYKGKPTNSEFLTRMAYIARDKLG